MVGFVKWTLPVVVGGVLTACPHPVTVLLAFVAGLTFCWLSEVEAERNEGMRESLAWKRRTMRLPPTE